MNTQRFLLKLALALIVISTRPAYAGPFDILDKVKETVDKVADAPKKVLEPVTGSTASDAENVQLLTQALAADKVTPEQEATIGREIAGNLLGAAPLVKDEKLQQYVNKVGRWLTLATDRAGSTWHFGVIDTPTINAFAAPGGYVLITRGLYDLLNNEAELAGVLGHEITHVLKQHHLKLLKQSSMIGVASNVVGKQVAGQPAALQNLIGNGAEIMARGLDKSAEYEADRGALVLTARAGYDPFAYFGVLERIAAAAKQNSASVSLLYKTHPSADDRLDALSNAAGNSLDGISNELAAKRFYKLAKAG